MKKATFYQKRLHPHRHFPVAADDRDLFPHLYVQQGRRRRHGLVSADFLDLRPGLHLCHLGISTAVTRLVADELVCGTPKSVRHILHRAIALSLPDRCRLHRSDFLWGGYHQRVLDQGHAGGTRPQDPLLQPAVDGRLLLPARLFHRPPQGGNPSRAQILEQAVRIAVVMLLIDRFASMGIAYACMAVMIGDTVAEFASCGHMALGYFLDRRRLKRKAFPAGPQTRPIRLSGGCCPSPPLSPPAGISIPSCVPLKISWSRAVWLSIPPPKKPGCPSSACSRAWRCPSSSFPPRFSMPCPPSSSPRFPRPRLSGIRARSTGRSSIPCISPF